MFEGPTPWPLFGNTLSIKMKPPGYEAFRDYAKQFGPIYTFWMGEQPVVIVTDYNIIYKAFVLDGDAYSGRNIFTDTLLKLRSVKGLHGIINTEGKYWQETRRFSLQALRELGMGRHEVEAKILLEVDFLCQQIENGLSNGETVQDLTPLIDIAVGSIINNFTFGFRYETKHYYQLKKILSNNITIFGTVGAQLVFNMAWLRHFPYFNGVFEQINQSMDTLHKYFESEIEKRVRDIKFNGSLNQIPSDVMDCFFLELDKHNYQIDDPNLPDYFRGILADLFIAGQETTSSTLGFIILYLTLDQRVQHKMQAELDSVTQGEARQITNEDRTKLSYTNAEGQRLCNLLPHNLHHRTTKDVVIEGHKIKAGTTIVPQISCVLYDEQIFPDPYKFIPERFLDDEKLKKIDEFIPFSVGKRICIGESLARMELFLIIANLFNNFELHPKDPLNLPSCKKNVGFALHTLPYKVKLSKRN